MLLERIEVVGDHGFGAACSAEEDERAHDLGVERLFPHDRSTRLDLAVEARGKRVGILAGFRADDQVLPLADRPVALVLELLLELVASCRDRHVTRTSQGA